MAIADVETGAAELAAKPVGRNGSATVVVAATAKALFAALSGLLLTCSLGRRGLGHRPRVRVRAGCVCCEPEWRPSPPVTG